MKSRIKIAFYTEWVDEKTFSPMVMIFYYKENINSLFYKELMFNIEDMRKNNSESSIDHFDKSFAQHEQMLILNQFKADKDTVERIFSFLIYASEIGEEKDTNFLDKKNELMSSIRKAKIQNALK